ncbi:hypothetical protein KR51_00007760 [Rubidibacter lacunae KORDI 51-2]|uniref:TIGR04255 family protein n=1 Tax=Rubidibacter lacunae KORDI 51-2 TaxID=582515 RepID=U5DLA7_9CHRO|nr:hypothetical protein [Rubidibacter lacunae]ERN42466.1 hypothetical protein KR51_00007760 [Rubidibacter lacunae KORDI 51-2]
MDAATLPTLQTQTNVSELAIAIAAQSLTPSLIAPEFLTSSGVVPGDWEFAKPPQFNQTQGRLTYKNGLGVVAQPRLVTFAEALSDRRALVAPDTARRFAERLPNADYQGVSIAPKTLVPFPDAADGPRNFIVGQLLAAGPWQQIGTKPPQAAVSLVYQFERCQLSLTITEVRLRPQNQTAGVPALLFSGSFNYAIVPDSPPGERLAQLQSAIGNWQDDLVAFADLVQAKFLGKPDNPLFPSGALPT